MMIPKVGTKYLVDENDKIVGELRTWFNHKQCVFTSEQVSDGKVTYTDGDRELTGLLLKCCTIYT